MPVTIGNGSLSGRGAIITTSLGDSVAVYINAGSVYVDKDVDGTPTNVDSDTAAVIFGGGGISWVHACIDGNDDIHVLAACNADQTRDIAYAICDLTTGFGTWEEAAGYTNTVPNAPGCEISLDSSDKPHIVFVDNVKQQGTAGDNVYYSEKTGASWASPTKIGLRDTKTDIYYRPRITVRNSDYIEVLYYGVISSVATQCYRTYTTSWGNETTFTPGGQPAASGVVSTTGGTVYRYNIDPSKNIEENEVDTGYNTHSTWGRCSANLTDSDRYIFYIDTNQDVHLISNDGGGWTDEGVLQTGTYQYVVAEWAYNNENQVNQINYIFGDGTDIFYDYFELEALTQVYKDIQAKWDIAELVYKDVQAKWDILNLVNKDIEAIWDILDEVYKDIQAKWDILDLVYKDIQAKWDIAELVYKDIQAKWDIRELVYKDNEAVWDILNLVNKDIQVKWDIFTLVYKDIQAKWDIAELVYKDIEAIWDILGAQVYKDIQAKWDILNLVNKDIQAKWDILNEIYKDIEGKYDIFGLVNKDIQAKWDILNLVNKDIQAKWDILNEVYKDIQAVWDMEGVVSKDIQAKWDILGEGVSEIGRKIGFFLGFYR